MIDAPSGRAPEQAPRWDLMDAESCGGEIRFLAPVLIVWGYVGIYRRKGINRLTGGPRGSGARPGGQARPCLVATSGTVSRGFFFPKIIYIPKKISVSFYPVWTLFDIMFIRNAEIGKKQQFWAGPPVNRLVPKII